MRAPYVLHVVGEEAMAKVARRHGWLSVSVATSIAWPEQDVWLEYDGAEYILRGAKRPSAKKPAPCIHTPSPKNDDEALARLYRFTSVLGYFLGGYVDITGRTWGTWPIDYATLDEAVGGLVIQGGKFNWDCNHMPVIEDDQVRKALAFLREGRRLMRVHEPYSFLSFFKVIESQFASKDRVDWVEKALDQLTEEDAVKRIKELRDQGINVNQHLFDSGRCAVAHASIGKDIVDPDIPTDRRRIAADLAIIAALANRYIRVDAGVPDHMHLYETRDRTAPWHALMTPKAVETMRGGRVVEDIEDIGMLAETTVSVRLWPEPPAEQFAKMSFLVEGAGEGSLVFMAYNERRTVVLRFLLDVKNGHVHTMLGESGMSHEGIEQDVEDFARYFHSVVANRTVELTVEGAEPVDCDVVIPVNIIPQIPDEAVARALEQFRRRKAQREGAQATPAHEQKPADGPAPDE